MEHVVIIMGSKSDKEKVEPAIQLLIEELGIDTGVYCLSAHRAHDNLITLIDNLILEDETLVIIAAAGMSAALPGIIASRTIIPVIGLPLGGSPLNGQEALFSMTEMPPGIPVATVGINNAKNAGLLAARIVANQSENVKKVLERYKYNMNIENIAANGVIHEEYCQKYSKNPP